MSTQHLVNDAQRKLQFVGDELAHVSSETPGANRWIEIFVYRTDAGRYVVAKVGQTRIEGEETRYSAQVSETPQGAVESLYMVDEDEVRYLTRIARAALDEASLLDEDLRNAYMLESI